MKIRSKNLYQQLRGNSGCKLTIFNKKNLYYVKKQSTNLVNSQRLEKQFLKLKKISRKKQNLFKFPIIEKVEIKKKLFSYEMKYISGINFSDYILSENYKFIENKIIRIIKIINLFKQSKKKKIQKNLIKNKILELQLKLNTKINKKFFSFLLNYNWEKINYTECHGDLSLENIIIHNDQIYLLDFSENFIESFYLDYSKILFDFISCWSIRNKTSKNSIQFLFAKQFYINFIIKNFSTKQLNLIKTLCIVDFLRVMNYSKNKKDYYNLNKKLENFYEHFDNPLRW